MLGAGILLAVGPAGRRVDAEVAEADSDVASEVGAVLGAELVCVAPAGVVSAAVWVPASWATKAAIRRLMLAVLAPVLSSSARSLASSASAAERGLPATASTGPAGLAGVATFSGCGPTMAVAVSPPPIISPLTDSTVAATRMLRCTICSLVALGMA
ncbi:hypothetical protein BH10ACT8_BH10ACT8_30650 [soil metagenome]